MKQCSVIVGEAAGPHETAPRRNASCAAGPVEGPAGFKARTIYEYLLECFERGGKNKAVGWREVLEIHEEKKKITKVVEGKETEVEKSWLYYELGPYRYNSYDELTEIMYDYGRGLVHIGMRPVEDKLHILAATSHKWMKTFMACQTQSITVVTAYDTLGESGLLFSMLQVESRGIFLDNNLLPKLIGPLQKAKNIKYVIHADKIDPEDKRYGGKMYSEAQEAVQKLKEVRPDLEIYSMDEVIELGKKHRDDVEVRPPRPDDVSCLMYTSGSTGDPKGVTLTHRNILASIGGICTIISPKIVHRNDRVIAFLPLAHILELTLELCAFNWGAPIGYATVKTLSDNSVRNCQGDMKEFKPTIMVSVAAVWESVRKGVLIQMAKLPPLTQKIFWAAYHAKLRMKKYHIPGGELLGNLIFKKVREATGGSLRLVLNGGSSISKETQVFISNLICPMLLGYGLTETVASATIVHPNHFDIGVVGDISGCVTMKLVDVEELGYFAKNNQGEVWIKGANVFSHYYKNEEETALALEDGWFKTGDIGEWTPRGQLRLIDRKKNLVKTLNGEYIALERLESIYRSNQYVENICVYADQHRVKPVGIVVPKEEVVAKTAIELGLIKDSNDVHSVYDNAKLKNVILADMHKTAKSGGLGGIELILGFVFSEEEWTPQNGYVTSAQKLQRRKILSSVQSSIDELYANNG